ncbi:MAG: hypothetical protein K2X87_06070 [Gemmataceae bacterium]|nr:hypothetical protein [Gemmataceae bacterium]
MQVHPFELAVSIVGAVVIGIVALATFFYVVSWLTGDSEARARRVGIKRVLNDRTIATVHLVSGTVFENVRFVGYTSSDSIKGGLPYELHGMVILEHPDGRRTLIQAKLVRMIEVPAPAR